MAGWHSAEVWLKIPSSAEEAFELISDFESYPSWQRAIEKAKILKATPRGKIVEFEANLLIRNIRYILDYHIDHENFCLSWDYVEGDILNTRGEFRLVPQSEKESQAFYRIEVELDFFITEAILFILKNTVMTGVLHDLARQAKKNLIRHKI